MDQPHDEPNLGQPSSRPGPARVEATWLELPGWLLLLFVTLSGPVGRVTGSHWALVTLASSLGLMAVAWRLGWRVRGWDRADAAGLTAGLVASSAVALHLRDSWHDDPFCHHAYTALIERHGMPPPAPGAPSRVADYHTAADSCAAALADVVPWGIEARLDLFSVLAHVCVALAALSLLRSLRVPAVQRALGVWTLMLGAGPLWLGRWLPALAPEGFPYRGDALTTLWEGGTYMSTLALSGRRSTVLGLLIGVLFARLVTSLRNVRDREEVPWGTGVLLGLCAAAAAQCADELAVLVVVATVVLAIAGGWRRWRRATLACVTWTPLAIAGGGFATAWLRGLLGGQAPVGASTEAVIALRGPFWPSFHGPDPLVWSVDGLRVLAMELLPALWVVPWLQRRQRLPQSLGRALMVWWGLGLFGATFLWLPSMGYSADLHRLLQPALALSLCLLPWVVAGEAAAVGVAWLVTAGPVGRVIQHMDALGVICAMSACLVLAALAKLQRRGGGQWLWMTSVAAALASLALCLPTERPQSYSGMPPSLEALLRDQGREAVVADGPGANLLLLQGHTVSAPWLRSDLEPVDHERQGAWLRQDAAAKGPFFVSASSFNALQKSGPPQWRSAKIRGRGDLPAHPFAAYYNEVVAVPWVWGTLR